jgi:hypothetical protein
MIAALVLAPSLDKRGFKEEVVSTNERKEDIKTTGSRIGHVR